MGFHIIEHAHHLLGQPDVFIRINSLDTSLATSRDKCQIFRRRGANNGCLFFPAFCIPLFLSFFIQSPPVLIPVPIPAQIFHQLPVDVSGSKLYDIVQLIQCNAGRNHKTPPNCRFNIKQSNFQQIKSFVHSLTSYFDQKLRLRPCA